MKKPRIRPLAMCVFRNHDRILVNQGYDSLKDEYFYRPLGGGIEFGEYGYQTIEREFREELGEEVTGITYLGTLESLFYYKDHKGHELVMVYDGQFTNPAVYAQDELTGREDDGSTFRVYWKELDFFRRGQAPLYPDGLLALLEKTN